MSAAEAREILSQWNGRLKDLALMRLAPDLCTTLAVHSSKVCLCVLKMCIVYACDFFDT